MASAVLVCGRRRVGKEMGGRVEIITQAERRRRWSEEEKLQ